MFPNIIIIPVSNFIFSLQLVVNASISGPYADVKEQIEELKREKIQNYKKIRELLDKIEESVKFVNNFYDR